jgi:DNA recombination protein RmuC
MLQRKGREAMRATIESLQVRLAETAGLLRAEKDKNAWTDDAKERFKDAFKVLAASELESKSHQLKSTAKDELNVVVAPLKEELTKLDRHVRDLEAKREGAYSTLGTQLDGLHKLQDSLRQQTTTLAQALRAPTIRGRWGEIHLRRLVELSGMAEARRLQRAGIHPVRQPPRHGHRAAERGILPIDAKVPLDAFSRRWKAKTTTTRKDLLVQHALAMRGRIRELAQRAYWDQFETTPEVVVMFVPVEGVAERRVPERPRSLRVRLSEQGAGDFTDRALRASQGRGLRLAAAAGRAECGADRRARQDVLRARDGVRESPCGRRQVARKGA